jgi:hypothetical protein
MIAFPPMFLPSVAVLNKKGLRIGILTGISLTTIGLSFRCLINVSYVFAIIGQTIMALAQPYLYNAPALVTTNWFPESERTISTMLGVSSNMFGVMLGFLFPYIFVGEYSTNKRLGGKYTQADYAEFRKEVFDL